MSPLRHLDRAAVSRAARKESRNREVYLPPISTFRWWARRTDAVNGALVEAFEAVRDGRMLVADPFAGGGVIPLAAATRGHRVYAQDINPWSARGLAAMMALPSPERLEAGRAAVREAIKPLLEEAYATSLPEDCGPAEENTGAGQLTIPDGGPGDEANARIIHTFRVATAPCPDCEKRLTLYPYAMVSLLQRKEGGATDCVLACERGHLFRGHSDESATCPTCEVEVDPKARYTGRRRVTCPHCDERAKLSTLATRDGWTWEVVLVERATDDTRMLGRPTEEDLKRARPDRWPEPAPLGRIPEGKETAVLRRHGFRSWNDLYPRRQQAVLRELLATIDEVLEGATRRALRIAALGTVEMAGLVGRWDRWYLKAYEAMANHRFNFTTFTAEPNVWGCEMSGRGSFLRRVDQLIRASRWLEEEAETACHFNVEGPIDTDAERTDLPEELDVRVVGGSSESMVLPDDTVDLLLTDPPYHDDVQYGELSLPFRAWAGQTTEELEAEAVVNGATGNGGSHYRQMLARIFKEGYRVLRPEGHLVFSYANRDPSAWTDMLWALQEAGFMAAGHEVLHAENETDLAKRGVRACTLDFVLDVVPADARRGTPWRPDGLDDTPESRFLEEVRAFFERLGTLEGNWEEELIARLEATDFLDEA